MYRLNKIIIFCYLLTALVMLTGCSQKDLFPKASLRITSDNTNIIPQSVDALPLVTYSVTPLNGVTSTLVSYSISYYSYLGEPIPSLVLPNIPINITIPGTKDSLSEGESVSLELLIFTARVRDLYANTPSDISPITAEITILFRDVNSNSGSITTYCSLFKFDSANTATEETEVADGS